MEFTEKVRAILNATCQPWANGDTGADIALNAEIRAAGIEFGKLLTGIGPRLQPATLENFDAKTNEQKKVLAVCEKYANNAGMVTAQGSNLILNGSMGTGKDHLVMGMAKRLHRLRKIVMYVDGVELQMRMGECLKGESERSMIAEYIAPDYLWISDPAINGIGLLPFQVKFFHAIIDGRYRGERLPTAEIPVPTPAKYDPVASGEATNPNMGMRQATREKLRKLKPFVSMEEVAEPPAKSIPRKVNQVSTPVVLDAEELECLARFENRDAESANMAASPKDGQINDLPL